MTFPNDLGLLSYLTKSKTDAHLRICLSQLPPHFQLPLEAGKAGPAADVSKMWQQEVEKGDQSFRHDARVEGGRVDCG
jgi:hypothetical protein